MDTDVLNNIPDCKKDCHWWQEYIGQCQKPRNIDCPKGNKPKQQTSTIDHNYS